MFARQRGADFVFVNLFDGVDRNNAYYGGSGLGGLGDYLLYHLRRNERADSVVYSYQVGVGGKARKGVLHGLLAGLPAFHHPYRLGRLFLLDQVTGPFHVLGSQRDNDFGYGWALQELADSVHQDGSPFEQHELLAAGAG